MPLSSPRFKDEPKLQEVEVEYFTLLQVSAEAMIVMALLYTQSALNAIWSGVEELRRTPTDRANPAIAVVTV